MTVIYEELPWYMKFLRWVLDHSAMLEQHQAFNRDQVPRILPRRPTKCGPPPIPDIAKVASHGWKLNLQEIEMENEIHNKPWTNVQCPDCEELFEPNGHPYQSVKDDSLNYSTWYCPHCGFSTTAWQFDIVYSEEATNA